MATFLAFMIHQAFLLALMLCEIHSLFNDATFEEVPLQGQSLEVYETGYAPSFGVCSIACSQKRLATPTCQAFDFDNVTNACNLYTESDDPIAVSSLQVFLYQITDRFHSIAVRDEQFFIYVSSVKLSFYDARIHCNEVGGYLLQFDSLTEYDAIIAAREGHIDRDYFVGATDEASEGTWVTDRDNTPLDNALWLWSGWEPDNWDGAEHCTMFSIDIGIGDIPCSRHKYFLCNKDVL